MANRYLSLKASLALATWLNEKRKKILEERPTRENLAIEASKHLGELIKPSHIKRAADAIDLNWTAKRSDAGKIRESLKLCIKVTARELDKLLMSLGVDRTKEFKAILEALNEQV